MSVHPNTTHFGYRTVLEEEKTSLVRGVFHQVASKYDVMNDAMSLGLHRLWKRDFITRLDLVPHMQCLDVAGGTGDIAFALRAQGVQQVTVCDINFSMLEQGRARAENKGILQGVQWLAGDAEQLPFPEHSFDRYTIAFGIRNVTRIPLALSEAFRVLRPGGKFACLEFAQVSSEWLRKLYDAYSFKLIPRMGQFIAGDSAPYQYLVESIRKFPPQRDFSKMLEEAGLRQVRYINLATGAVAIHTGYKL